MSGGYVSYGGGSGGGGGGSGTVTSVDMTVPSFLSIAGVPITTSGTIALTLATQSANTVFAGPTSGGAAMPTYRSLVGADLPNPSSTTLGGVRSAVAVSHQWINSISTSGIPALSQPAFTDISGTATGAQLPLPAVASLGGVFSKAVVSHNFLTGISSADGSVSQAQPAFTDISGTATGSQLPLPAVASLGGVFSKAVVSNNFLTGISSVDGSVSQAQPAFTNISGSVAASQMPALTGDVTTSAGAVATTVAKIQSVTVSGVTGTANVAFSDSPNFTTSVTFATNYHLNPVWGTPVTGTTTGTLDFSTGTMIQLTLTASNTCVLTVSNIVTAGTYRIKVLNKTGALITWPASFDWGAVGAPVLSGNNVYDDVNITVEQSTANVHAFWAGGFSN